MGASFTTLNGKQITDSITDGIVESERAMRMLAEQIASGFRSNFLEIVEAIAPDFLEEHRDAKPATWPPEQWKTYIADLLIRARRRLGAQNELIVSLQRQLGESGKRQQELMLQIQALQEELTQRSQSQLRRVREQSSIPSSPEHSEPDAEISSQLEIAPSPKIDIDIPQEPPAGWTFTSLDAYAIDARLIALVGKTGRCSRPWLAGQVAALLNFSSGRNSTILRAFERCKKSGWIDVLEATGQWAKGYPHLIRLSPSGEQLYRDLCGEDPAASVVTRLLDQHAPRGIDHAVLCIAAATQFEQLGFVVTVLPSAIEINQHVYEPDLWVERETEIGEKEVWLVECERGSGSSGDKRAAKWNNAVTVQGRAYIVAPEASTRDRLADEVLAIDRPCQVFATDMSSLRNARTPDGVWVVAREAR